MGKFVVLDSPHAVTKFWHDVQTRIATRKERDMPLTKSVSEVAWAAVYALARDMVAAGDAPDVDSAVQQLRLGNHPVYATYLAAQASGAPTPTTPAADVGKVLKAAQEAALAKRRTVFAEVNKRVDRLVRSGQAANAEEAMGAVFKADRDLYNQHREASYATAPLPPVAPEPGVVPTGPVQAEVSRLAKALKADDPWGRLTTASEPELVEEVFKRHPALYWAHRAEVLR